MTAGIAFDNTPPPIALEPLLAFPIRDPAFAGAAGPAPGLNQSPIYHVGGYRSLIFSVDILMNPGPPAPGVTISFFQGWPSDSLPGSAAGPGTLRPVWSHTALVPPISNRYWMAARIPVVAPLFAMVIDPVVLGTGGTQQFLTATLHGTDQHCSEVQPLDTPVIFNGNGQPLRNRRFFVSGGGAIPAGGFINLSPENRRWYVGRAYLSWITNAAAGAASFSLGPPSSIIVQGRVAANTWQTDEIEVPSDLEQLGVNGAPGVNVLGAYAIGTQPLP